ncbi:Blue light-and temperature-regulated antirepressor YcgF [Jannaschia donghaensis]|uniref:Blue light-and temperature-regulated antirepressor YcgF n=1 Tax=Jannaschia donghaensis TaxID=420998 RepID=A0A0M6YFJ1_9RHOB|nr:Blue light-and temperature-regulated antirepressor YcgF [Jannaschia donghaensis]
MSQPFGYDVPTLDGILRDARRFNERDGITGALVCRHDVYLQMLEGPADKVDETYMRIEQDDRHANMTRILRRDASERLFGDWAMLHDPARSWIWSQADLEAGVLDRATPAEIVDVFETLARRVSDGGTV